MSQGLPEKPIYLFPLAGEMMGHIADGYRLGEGRIRARGDQYPLSKTLWTAPHVPYDGVDAPPNWLS